MRTNQLYWYHDKIDRTKTHRTSRNTEYTKRQQTIRKNFFVVFLFSLFIFHLDVKNTNGPYRNPHNITKHSIQRRNRHSEISIFLLFG